ncbi:MAG TPA: hypothetical protein VK818_11350, partial [Methylomirabilota bacterium]|nr:hypothetical protein [Methylomirabilota bacterium]
DSAPISVTHARARGRFQRTVSFGEGDLEGKQLRSAVYQETRKTTTKIGFYEWLKFQQPKQLENVMTFSSTIFE